MAYDYKYEENLDCSTLITWAEFRLQSGAAEARLQELLDLGWIEPSNPGDETPLFRGLDLYKTRKLERICCDFEFPSLAGAIIVDLLERIESLERKSRK